MLNLMKARIILRGINTSQIGTTHTPKPSQRIPETRKWVAYFSNLIRLIGKSDSGFEVQPPADLNYYLGALYAVIKYIGSKDKEIDAGAVKIASALLLALMLSPSSDSIMEIVRTKISVKVNILGEKSGKRKNDLIKLLSLTKIKTEADFLIDNMRRSESENESIAWAFLIRHLYVDDNLGLQFLTLIIADSGISVRIRRSALDLFGRIYRLGLSDKIDEHELELPLPTLI